MTAASDRQAVEDFRRQCEARHWLACGYQTPQRVDDLMTRIAAKRGQAAADELREEMRVQWRLLREARAA